MKAITNVSRGWLLLGAVFLACQAGSYYVEHRITSDNVGADLLTGVIGFVMTCVVLKLIYYIRGAGDRREEREYYSDDLDGTWLGRRPDEKPPSILT